MRNWNPRYVQYARLNGKTPDEMLEHDRNGYGATMTRFILFISQVKTAFFKEQPDQNCYGGIRNHAEFDKFIANYVDQQLSKQYYVHIDTEMDEPHTVGPFATRQEAEDYAETVNYDTEIREVQHDQTQAVHPRGWDKV